MVHEVNISYAFFEFFIAYVVDGVQKLIFRACGFRDGFAHLFIGHLDVEYDGNMVFLHLIHEEGNSCRIGFRISGAAGESGVVGQAEFFSEIKEGETVTDDDFFSLRVINDVMEILIQFFQFRNVSLSVFLISLGIVLVETGNGFGEGFYDLDSVGGRVQTCSSISGPSSPSWWWCSLSS